MSDYVTVKEAAVILGCSPRSIWRAIADGRLRKYGLGRRTLKPSTRGPVVRLRREDVAGLVSPGKA